MLRGIRAVRLQLRPSRQPLWWSLRQRVTRRRLVQEEISLRPLRRSVSEPMRNRRDAVEADAARVLALEEVRTPPPPQSMPPCAASVCCAARICHAAAVWNTGFRHGRGRAQIVLGEGSRPAAQQVLAIVAVWERFIGKTAVCCCIAAPLLTTKAYSAMHTAGRASRDRSFRCVRIPAVTRKSPSQR